MGFIFITLLIDVIGFGLIIPVLPHLVETLSGGKGAAAAQMYGYTLAVFGLFQFLFAPVLGNLSDRYGRRPVLLLSLFFTAIDYLIQAMAPNMAWLFAGRIMAGITGASFTVATSYISDISPPEKRAQNYGIIGAAFGLGFITGPALGGVLGDFGPRVPFWAAAIACVLNLLYGMFILPESLSEENRRPLNPKSMNPFSSLGILGRSPLVIGLAAAGFLNWLAQQVPPSVWVLYTSYRFNWSGKENGWSLALLGACSIAVQVGLIRFLSPRLGDAKMLVLGTLMNVVGFVLLGSSTTSQIMLMSMMVWTTSFMAGPALQSIFSQQFGADEQGGAQGALSSLQSLSGVVAPPVLTAVFAKFTEKGAPVIIPGAAFYLGAFTSVLSGLLIWSVLRQWKPTPPTTPPADDGPPEESVEGSEAPLPVA